MENWLLNWTAWILRNTHAHQEDPDSEKSLTYESNPTEWIHKSYEMWENNSDYGKKIKEEKGEKKNTITYTLDQEESKKLKEWQEHIKAIYGSYGDYVYSFESGGGIGIIKKVWSKHAQTELDLTDIEKW
jgi:hypothetical protein